MITDQYRAADQPLLAEPARRLRDPLCQAVARCDAVNDAAALLADRLADDPKTLLLLIKAHLARAARSAAA